MGTLRTVARQLAPPERKTAPPVSARKPADAPTRVQLLQLQLGNQGTAAFVARSSLNVSSPHDPAERGAVAKAAEIMRMSAPVPHNATRESTGIQRCSC